MALFINHSHLLLKHLIQDYAVNLFHRLQRRLFIHFGLLRALCWLCEVSSFKDRKRVLSIAGNGLLSLIFSLFAQQCSAGFDEESYSKSEKYPLVSSISETDTLCCNSADKIFSSTL